MPKLYKLFFSLQPVTVHSWTRPFPTPVTSSDRIVRVITNFKHCKIVFVGQQIKNLLLLSHFTMRVPYEVTMDTISSYKTVWLAWYKLTKNLKLMTLFLSYIWKGLCPAVDTERLVRKRYIIDVTNTYMIQKPTVCLYYEVLILLHYIST